MSASGNSQWRVSMIWQVRTHAKFHSIVQNIEEALRRTPQDVLDARIQRHKRAMDLSLKHISLPKEMQEQQTPFQSYLQV